MSTKDSTLTQEYLQSVFIYSNGNLYRKKTISNQAKDKIAGHQRKNGYCEIGVLGKVHKLHRVIFLYHHGWMPNIVDHIDGNILNNNIENLREANCCENIWNSKLNKRNKTGTKGVSWDKKSKQWIVSCSVNGKRHYLGIYKELDVAKRIATWFRNKNHKNFARHK